MHYQFYCRQSKKDRHGEAPIELSVVINGKRSYIQLPFRTTPERFALKRQPKEIQKFIDSQRARLNRLIADLAQMGLPITVEQIKSYFITGGIKSYKVEDLFRDYLTVQKERDCSHQIYHKYEFVRDLFFKIADRNKECSAISNNDIRLFVAAVEKKYQNSTAISYLTKLKAFIRYGLDNAKIPVNPLQGIKIGRRAKSIDYLTEQEIQKLVEVTLDTVSLNNVRDCALFQISSGLSYCDCLELEPNDLQEKDGTYFISKNRHKTGTPFFAVVLSIGVKVFYKWNGKIPFISNQKYNLFLKVLGERAGIKKNLHTHLFRHTYCTLLLNNGVSIKTVSRCAGHSTSKMTESFYAFLKEETVLKEVSKAMQKGITGVL